MFKKIILAVVLLVIIVFAALYIVRNQLVKAAVEKGGTYSLGVETELGSAGLDLGGGSLELNDYEIANPEGFSDNNFFTLKHAVLDVDEGSLLDKEVVVDSLVIDGVELNLEQIDAKGNYKVLLDHIKSVDFGSSSESSSKKLRIKKVSVKDVAVNGTLTVLGKTDTRSFKVDDFTMENVGGSQGGSIGEVTGEIVKKIITKASSNQQFLKGVNLDSVKEKADETIKDVESQAKDKLKDLGGSLTGGK